MATTSALSRDELRFYASQPVFEIYSHEESGARIVLHAWLYVDGEPYTGATRTYPPQTGRGLAHVHAGIEQRCVVHRGRATYRLGVRSQEAHVLEAGEQLVIPAGAPHVDPYNDADEPLCMATFFSPGTLGLISLGRALGEGLRDGRLNEQHDFEPLHLMVLLDQPGNETFAAGIPPVLQRRVAIPLAAALGRRRGYRVPAGMGRR